MAESSAAPSGAFPGISPVPSIALCLLTFTTTPHNQAAVTCAACRTSRYAAPAPGGTHWPDARVRPGFLLRLAIAHRGAPVRTWDSVRQNLLACACKYVRLVSSDSRRD